MSDFDAGISSRREAREEALGLLYELEVTGDPLQAALAAKPLPPADYALQVIEGVISDLAKLDERISVHLLDWTVDRLAVVDRVLARMATWELCACPDVPTGVVLSEAVELASQYSGEQSPRFLNGVLRAVASEVRDTPSAQTKSRCSQPTRLLASDVDHETSPVRLEWTGASRVAKRERLLASKPDGGVFKASTQVMTASDVKRAIQRMAHEIVERNSGCDEVVIIGLQTGGVDLAERLANDINEIEGANISVGSLDATMHRDDFDLRPITAEAATVIPVDPTGKIIVLVDDVLYTGRTVRAALDAIHSYGRPKAIQLAVMIDRGHRELPIRPDFVGKNLPTRRAEMVDVSASGVKLGEVS